MGRRGLQSTDLSASQKRDGYSGYGSKVVEFPVYLRIGSVALHPHWLFETLAYIIGTRLYLALKARWGDPIRDNDRWSVVAAAVVGCAVGSKFMYWLSDPAEMLAHADDPFFLMGG